VVAVSFALYHSKTKYSLNIVQIIVFYHRTDLKFPGFPSCVRSVASTLSDW
jgi:hypothetical protein